MSEYPKVISVDGANFTVESAADEALWRGNTVDAAVPVPEPVPDVPAPMPPDVFPPEHQPEPEPEPEDDAPKKKAPSHTHKGLGDKKK